MTSEEKRSPPGARRPARLLQASGGEKRFPWVCVPLLAGYPHGRNTNGLRHPC